jgi:hypothetical protein
MLSKDEVIDGRTFIMKLPDAAGGQVQWTRTLRGDEARHWFDIYRRSDWQALRDEAADVFGKPVTAEEADRTRRSRRCVVIQTLLVESGQLLAGRHPVIRTDVSNEPAGRIHDQ